MEVKPDTMVKHVAKIVRADAAELVNHLIEAAQLHHARTIPVKDLQSCVMAILKMPLPGEEPAAPPSPTDLL